MWRCRCTCGNECIVSSCNLRRGNTTTCGCGKIERIAKLNKTHGMRHTSIYSVWCGIKKRCYNPNDKKYKDYGGRGITMFEGWIHNFQAFYDYVSQLENYGRAGYTLDRENNDGNYEPGNLRWATPAEQNRNQRTNIIVEYEGEQIILKDAAKFSGIKYGTLFYRYHAGDRGEQLFRPVRN